MPLRGSAQLLLLFLRSRKRRAWVAGAIAGGAVAAGLFFGGGVLSTGTELAQQLRESAWDRALADPQQQSPWPWAESPVVTGKVQRLGLSAAIVENGKGRSMRAVYEPLSPAAVGAPMQPGTMLSELAAGDRITVTTADGNSRFYRVTGPKVVDPHLAGGDSQAASGDAREATCVPLDPLLARSLGLVIQSIRADPPAPTPDQEQKL